MSVVGTRRPLAFALLLACALLTAGPSAQAAGSGSLGGVVTDVHGQPVADVTVRVDGPGADDQTLWTTDGDGRYVATGLAAGRHTVCFLPPGDDLADECWEDVEPSTPAFTPVELGQDQEVIGIDAELVPASHLRGVVTDTRGEPVAAATVSAYWSPPNDPDNMVLCCVSATTGADGSFELGPLYSGEYALRFSDPVQRRYASEWWGGATAYADASWLEILRGRSLAGLDAVLETRPHLSGRVTGPAGTPARDAVVRVFRLTGSQAYSVAGSSPVAADGSYEVAGLEPGAYRVRFDAAPGRLRSEYWRDAPSLGSAQDVEIPGTTPVTGLDAVLRLAPPVRVLRMPSLTGRPRVGERLRVTTGRWDVSQVRFAYVWRADGALLRRADGPGLRLTPALRGARISVRVTATAVARERSPGTTVIRSSERVGPRRS